MQKTWISCVRIIITKFLHVFPQSSSLCQPACQRAIFAHSWREPCKPYRRYIAQGANIGDDQPAWNDDIFDDNPETIAAQQVGRRLVSNIDSHRHAAVRMASRAIAADPYAADQFQPLIDCIVSGGLPVRTSPGSLRHRCAKPIVEVPDFPPMVLGSGCLEDSDCLHFPNKTTAFRCDLSTKTCTAQRAGLGEVCTSEAMDDPFSLPLSQVCSDGLYCDGASTGGGVYSGTCKKRLPAGSVCPMAQDETTASVCAAGTTCVMSYPATEQTGHCRALGSLPVGTRRGREVNDIADCLGYSFGPDLLCETGYASC